QEVEVAVFAESYPGTCCLNPSRDAFASPTTPSQQRMLEQFRHGAVTVLWRAWRFRCEHTDQAEYGLWRLALCGWRDEDRGNSLAVAVFSEVCVDLRLEVREFAKRLRIELADRFAQLRVLAGVRGEDLESSVGVGGPGGGASEQTRQQGRSAQQPQHEEQPQQREPGAGQVVDPQIADRLDERERRPRHPLELRPGPRRQISECETANSVEKFHEARVVSPVSRIVPVRQGHYAQRREKY